MPRLGVAALLFGACALAQIPEHIEFAKLADGFQFTAGPAWSRDGFLVFSDVPAGRQYHLIPPASETDKPRFLNARADSGGASGNAYDAQGRLYTCETHARRVTRTGKKGIEVLASKWEGKRLNAPQSIVVRPDGHAWFTDPAFGSANDTRDLDFYGVFHLDPKGGLTLAAKWRTRPAGLALSPNGATLYVSDADRHTVHAFDLDRGGAAAHDRVFIPAIDGVPTGLCVDGAGNLYVSAKLVFVYTAAGKLADQLNLGVKPSACAFATDGSLYVTARSAVFRVKFKRPPPDL